MPPFTRFSFPLRALLFASLVAVGLQPGVATAATSQGQAEKKAIAALDVRSGDDPVIVFRQPARVARNTPIHQAGVTSPRAATATLSRSRGPRRAGVTVSSAPVVLRTGDEAAWLFYEDRAPYQAYQHAGRVVLVGAESGRVQVSRSLRWPPLIDGDLPRFLAGYDAYRDERFRVFARGWQLEGSASSRATADALLTPTAPDYLGAMRATPPATPARQQAADQLAAERSCAIRISDTLGSFYDVGPVDRTRQALGTMFNQLARLNPQFFTARYRYREGRTPQEFVANAIERNGCKDVLLYLGGGGYAGSSPAVNVGTRGLGDGRIEQQVVTATTLRSVLRAHRGVTFKVLIDAPYSGGFLPVLRPESNLLFLASSSGAREAAFTALADVVGRDGHPVTNAYNPRGFLEFSNRMLTGLGCFLSRPDEVAAATRAKADGRTRSFLAWMLGRSFALCAGGSLGDRVAGGPTPVIYVAGGTPTEPTAGNRAPVAAAGSVATDEDAPVAIKLSASDADGQALRYAVTGGPAHGRVTVEPGDGSSLVYTPDRDFAGSDALTFTATDGIATSAPAPVSIAVGPVDDSPVVSLGGGTTTFTEPGPAVAVDPGLDVEDVDDTSLVGATVRITNGFAAGEDELVFVDQAGISGDYDATSGVLTLSGDAPLAAYRTALRSITFANGGANPIAGPRDVRFVVDDGERTSDPVVRPVAFVTVNDAPLLGGGGTTAGYTEDDTVGVAVAPSITVSDVDNTTLAGATLTISGGHAPLEDELVFVDQSGISGDYDAPTGVLTLSGTATKAQYETALRSVRYRNLNVGQPSTAARTIGVQIDDGSDANALSAVVTTGVTVTAVNDAPTATAGGGSPTYSEGDSPLTVDPGVTVADVDDTQLTGATVTIGAGFDSADDVLALPTTPLWATASFSPVTGELTISGTASKADYQALLRTVTYVNDDGDDPSADARTIAFRVRDGALTSDPASTTLTVVPVNDAPVLSGGGNTVTFEEDDTAGVVVNSAVAVSDVDNASMVSATVQIASGFVASEDELVFGDQAGITGSYDATTGVLTLTGSASKAAYETALRSVRYRNTNTGNPSETARTVQFRVDDGTATSNVSNAVVSTVDIDPSNDAPQVVAGGGSPVFTEGGAAVAVGPAAAVTDVDDTTLTGATVTIGAGFAMTEDELSFIDTATITGTYNAATGVLTLTGNDTVAAYQAALRTVHYANTNDDDPSPTSRQIAFEVSDASLTSAAATTTVGVTPVNDAPTLGGAFAAVTYTENGSGVALDTALTVADVDSTNLAGATVRLTTNFASAEDRLLFADQNGITGSYDAATGILTLTGSASKAAYETALRSVGYRNVSDDPSNATRTFSIAVTDGASTNATSGSRTGTVAVVPVNDAPTITAGSTSASFVEDSLTGVVVDPTVTVADVDSPTLSSATVAISGNWNAGEDVLALPATPGLSAIYNPGSGVLTITGTATPAAYQAALRTVTYANTNTGNPATVDRGIDFAVNDGLANSNTASATVSVVPVNDAPTVSLLTGSSSFVEATTAAPGTGPVAIDASALVADVDDGNLEGATLVISANLSAADDQLLFTDQNGITGEYTAATGTLTLTGTATVAEYQAAIRSVQFTNLSDTPSTATRTISVTVTDGDLSSATATRGVTVTASDDLPTVTLSGSAPDFTEAGSPVVVDDGLTVADVDSANLQSATVCVCSGRVDDEDELLYTPTNGVTATAYNPTTGTLTLAGPGTKADFEAALRTVKYRNTDLTTPDPGPRGIRFTVNDGSNDSVPVSKTLTITTLNDPPVLGGGGNTVNYVEDDPATVVNGALTVVDGDDTELESATVAVTGNFDATEDELQFAGGGGLTGSYNATTGVLTISGTATTAAYQAALRTVRYVNNDHVAPSSASRTISFVANDGEEDSDPADTTITVAQNPDAPTVTTDVDAPASFTENGSPVVVDDGITVADVDSTTLSGATVDITSGFSAAQGDVLAFTPSGSITGSYDAPTGVLTLTGSGTKAEYQSVLRSVTYANTSEDPTTSRTVRFRVVDDTSATSAGATRTVDIVPVNDAPTLAGGGTLAYTENDAATAISTALTVADVDNASLSGASVGITGGFANGQDRLSFTPSGGITGSYSTSTGVLTLSGTATKAQYQTVLRSVAYDNMSDNPSTAARTITYTVSDAGTPVLSGTTTATVNVTAVNDDPVADDETFSGTDSAIGNTSFVGNDPTDGAPDPTGPQKTITADILNGDTDVEGDTVSVVPGTFASNDGGSVTVEADGDFTFTPAAGTSCSDTSDFFDYTVTDGQTPTPGTDTGRVTIAITDCVWFVDNQAAAGGNGRSGTPFDTLAEADTAATTTGAYLYVYKGDGATTGLTGGASLLANQRLVGAAEDLTVAGTALESGLDANRPAISGGVTLGAGNTVEGLAITTSGANAIDGGSGDASGTLDDLVLTPSGAAGGGISLNGTSGTWNVSNVAITSTSGAQGIFASSAGTVNFASAGTISVTAAGPAVSLLSTATSGAIDTTTSTGGSYGWALNAVTGSLDLGTGSVSGHTSTEVSVTAGTGDVTYAGTIGNGSGTSAVIQNRTAGAVTLSGTIGDTSDAGGGISMSGNSGGSTTFSGATKTLNTGSSDAVSAAFTGNHALRFTGGGLDIDTTSGAGLSATTGSGSGLLSVTGTGNSSTTTTGRALDVNGPDIELAGLTFQSVASNGAPSGIRLANTGSAGGLTVTGSGATAGSGGTITASVGPGVDLSSTAAVSLARLNVTNGGDDGIRGASVNGLTLTANSITGNGNATGENGLDLTELSGTSAVTGATVTGNYTNQVSVDNDAATVTGLTVDGGTYGNSVAPGGNDGFLLQNTGTGGLTATIQNTLMTMNRGDHVQVTTDASNAATQNVSILDNTMRGDGNQPSPVTLGGGITVNPAGAANTTVRVQGNDIERAADSAIVVNSPLASTATVKATITGNAIGTAGEARSGSSTGDGIYVNGHGNSTITTLIQNNEVRSWTNAFGIDIVQNDGDGTINATVQGNTLAEPDPTLGLYGMRLSIGGDAADGGTSCLDIGHPSNTALKNRVVGTGIGGGPDIRFRMAGGASGAPSTAQLPGYAGGPNDTAAVNVYLQGRNNIGGTPIVSSSQFDAFSLYANVASCPQP